MATGGGGMREIAGLYRVIPFKPLRRTPDVSFDLLPIKEVPRIDAIDRVMHGPGAFSPGSVGEIERPWYMHTHQADHLIVLHGRREVEIYTPDHGRIEHFVAEPDRLLMNGELLHDGPAVLVWPTGVFHRIISPEGSASLNLATHYEGFNLDTNFNVYDLDVEAGEYTCIREGRLDQPSG